MATGKQVGEFALKATSLTLTPGPGGSVLVQGNFDGPSAAFGAILRTATFVSVGSKNGTFSVCAAAYLENGDVLTGNGQGAFESVGRHKWRTQELFHVSDGNILIAEGEIDLAAHTWIGKIFERS